MGLSVRPFGHTREWTLAGYYKIPEVFWTLRLQFY